MVNHTALHPDPEIFDDECPDTDYGNHTDQQQDGEYDWSTSKQGWILSSFFYGYVLTQVGKQTHVLLFKIQVSVSSKVNRHENLSFFSRASFAVDSRYLATSLFRSQCVM